jgi:hypothetical protein
MSTNLAVALELASAGIAVFPARVFKAQSGKWQKRPLVNEWQKCATTNHEQIRRWWRGYPNAVPGIWCGHSGLDLVVIDTDRHEGGADGVEAFAQLIVDLGIELPPHPTTQTPSGGFHHVFCQPDGAPIGNETGALPPGIDVRGKGGWIVAPGAVRSDGATWSAVTGTPPLTQAYREQALCDKLAVTVRAPKNGNGAAPSTHEEPRIERATMVAPRPANIWQQQASIRERVFAAAALTNLADALASTAPGQRNRKLYDCAFRLGTMIARGWIDRIVVANALWTSCRTNGLTTDDGDDSVQKTLASGFKDGTACPHEDLKDRDSADEPHTEKPSADERANNRRATLNIVAADEFEMCGVDWLWPGRFALGKIGLIAGLPDMGKGQIAAFLAAVVTAILELPCNEGTAPQGNVIWFNAEDDARDTVKPRLIAAGADPKRVHFVNSTQINGVDKGFSLVTDLPPLREAIKKIGNVVLIIIDPVSAYLGIGKVDGRSATDVRGVLTPLKEMAEELHVAVIGIAHFNKKDDIKSALLRVSDSIAYVAAARHVYAVLDDPEDKDSKLFVKAKNNLAPDKKALRYGVSVKTVGHDPKLNVDIDAPYIVWHPQYVEITANEAMQASGGHTAKREAREFLLKQLEAGPAKSDEVLEEAKQEGIAEKTLRRAKKELGIKSRKQGGPGTPWVWELPPKRERWPSS